MVLSSRQLDLLYVLSRDFVTGYSRFARYCLPDKSNRCGGLTARHAITAELIDTIERKKMENTWIYKKVFIPLQLIISYYYYHVYAGT